MLSICIRYSVSHLLRCSGWYSRVSHSWRMCYHHTRVSLDGVTTLSKRCFASRSSGEGFIRNSNLHIPGDLGGPWTSFGYSSRARSRSSVIVVKPSNKLSPLPLLRYLNCFLLYSVSAWKWSLRLVSNRSRRVDSCAAITRSGVAVTSFCQIFIEYAESALCCRMLV